MQLKHKKITRFHSHYEKRDVVPIGPSYMNTTYISKVMAINYSGSLHCVFQELESVKQIYTIEDSVQDSWRKSSMISF